MIFGPERRTLVGITCPKNINTFKTLDLRSQQPLALKPSLNETRICGKTTRFTAPGCVLELGQSLDVPTAQGMPMDQRVLKYHGKGATIWL